MENNNQTEKPAAGRPNAITQAKPAPDAIAAALDAYGQLLAESDTPFTADKYTKLDAARAEHVRNKAELAALRAALEALLEADTAICENIGTKSNQAMQRIAALDTARAELNP